MLKNKIDIEYVLTDRPYITAESVYKMFRESDEGFTQIIDKLKPYECQFMKEKICLTEVGLKSLVEKIAPLHQTESLLEQFLLSVFPDLWEECYEQRLTKPSSPRISITAVETDFLNCFQPSGRSSVFDSTKLERLYFDFHKIDSYQNRCFDNKMALAQYFTKYMKQKYPDKFFIKRKGKTRKTCYFGLQFIQPT